MKKLLPILAGAGFLIFPAMHAARADGDDKPDAGASAVKRNANGEMVVTVDAATQKLIKLEVASLTTATWQPALTAYGRVLDPTPLITAVADLAAARITADGSARELARLKILAAQDNATTRALESAQLAAEHDRLALESLRATFGGSWGSSLAGRKDLPDFARQLTDRKASVVRLVLPAGDMLTNPPVATGLKVFPDDNHLVPADLLELNLGVDPQTQGQVVLLLVKDRALPWGAAVTGRFSLTGQPLSGVEIPAAAALRHDGLGWVYLQTGGDKFTRHEIPLDHLTPNGWFVTGDLATTNMVVTGGAETVLSAELSNGGFNTGTRD